MNVSRRNFFKTMGIGVVGLSSAVSLAACGGASGNTASQGSKAKDEVIIVMSASSEPESGFDPFFSWGCGEHVHEPLLQSTLVTTDVDLNFVNDLATDYSCSADGLTWTFNIRSDVKFTDGKALTAKDVAFTLNGIKNFAGSELDLSYLDSVEAASDTKAVFHLNKPFNALLYTLAVVGIVPEHAYDAKTYGSNPIGSGRYMLEQWDKGQQVIFKSNPDYYGTAPKMNRVVVLFAEEDAALAQAQAGKADIVFTASTLAKQAPKGYELFVCKSVDCRGVSLPAIASGSSKADGQASYPAGNDVTCNLEVRQAINLAIDRQKLVDNTLDGYGTVAYSVCDNLPWGSADMAVKQDLSAAEKKMTDAGWAKGSDGIFAKDGKKASFELLYPTSDSVRQAISNEFANQLKSFGIEVKLTGSSWTKDPSGLYYHQFSDPIMWGWGANSPTQLYDLTYSSGAGNYASYENAKIDAHMDAALAKTKVEDSFDDWKAAQWDGTDGVAPQGAATWVWLANIDHLYFKREGLNVAKQKMHPHGHGWSLANNVDQWTW